MKLPLVLVSLALVACGPAKFPTEIRRDSARATVTLLAEAVLAADQACATAIESTKSEPLGEKCKRGYDVARASLLAAEASIDAYNAGRDGVVSCAILRATSALAEIAAALNTVSMPPPASVVDAVTLGSRLGFTCPGDA